MSDGEAFAWKFVSIVLLLYLVVSLILSKPNDCETNVDNMVTDTVFVTDTMYISDTVTLWKTVTKSDTVYIINDTI